MTIPDDLRLHQLLRQLHAELVAELQRQGKVVRVRELPPAAPPAWASQLQGGSRSSEGDSPGGARVGRCCSLLTSCMAAEALRTWHSSCRERIGAFCMLLKLLCLHWPQGLRCLQPCVPPLLRFGRTAAWDPAPAGTPPGLDSSSDDASAEASSTANCRLTGCSGSGATPGSAAGCGLAGGRGSIADGAQCGLRRRRHG